MNPTSCPIFQACAAAICPLDPSRHQAAHLKGEPVCRYLLASGKAGAADYYRDDPVFVACQEHLAEVCARHPDIARQVRTDQSECALQSGTCVASATHDLQRRTVAGGTSKILLNFCAVDPERPDPALDRLRLPPCGCFMAL